MVCLRAAVSRVSTLPRPQISLAIKQIKQGDTTAFMGIFKTASARLLCGGWGQGAWWLLRLRWRW